MSNYRRAAIGAGRDHPWIRERVECERCGKVTPAAAVRTHYYQVHPGVGQRDLSLAAARARWAAEQATATR